MPEAEFLSKAEGVIDWFTPLNPYTAKGPVFKIEAENYGLLDGNPTDHLEPLFCYAISPKRYVLFNRDKLGRPVIRKATVHGLGHLRPPLDHERIPPSIPKPTISLRELDVKAWQYSLWYRILVAALAGAPDQPMITDLPGFSRPATTPYGASTPGILAWCKGYNKGRDYADQIKPFNFLLRFYVPLVTDGRPLDGDVPLLNRRRQIKSEKLLRPIAPFNLDAGEAAKQCFDRATGENIAAAQLSTYSQELAQYHIHPDSKFLNAEYFDAGVTQRRHVIAANIHHIGKEADNLEEQLEHGVDPDAVLDYGIGFEGFLSRWTNYKLNFERPI